MTQVPELNVAVEMWMVGRSQTTVSAYHYYMKDLDAAARQHFGKSLLAVDDLELHQLFDLWRSRLKPSTLHTRTMMIRSFFGYVQQKKWRPDNPAAGLRPPKFEKTLAQRILTHEQVQALVHAADCERDRLIVKTLYLAALRVSELCNLRKRHIKPTSLEVFGKGQRTEHIRIPEELGKALLEWSAAKSADDYLFTALSGGLHRITRVAVGQIVRRLAKRAGIAAAVSPHFLRHTHATVALQNGANLRVVQRTLRHRSIETTELYLHTMPEEGSSLVLPTL